MNKVLTSIQKYVLYALLFLLPIFVLSTSPNPFIVPKIELLTYGLGIIILIWAVQIIISGKINLNVGNFDFPVALVGLSYLLSAILRSDNKPEAYLLPGSASVVLAGVFIYYFINQLGPEAKRMVVNIVFASGVAYALLTLFGFTGVLTKIPQLPSYIQSQGFTPEGGYLPSATFLLVILPLALGLIMTEKDNLKKTLIGVCTAVVVFGLAISVYNLLPGRPFSPRFPDLNSSWQISVETLKLSPILGIGPGNYLTAFNRFRPLSFNQSDLWAIKFTTANNFYLTLLTETGLLGFASIVILLFTLYKAAKADLKEKKLVNWGFSGISTLVSLVLMAVLFLFIPATTLLVIILLILFSLNAKVHTTRLNLFTEHVPTEGENYSQQIASRFPALLLTIPVIIGVIIIGIVATRGFLAEYYFTKSINALANNDAQNTYSLMVQAINLNPQVDRYHASFSQVNFLLANAIAQKKDITDQDRTNIANLIQQSIQEGKASVSTNPNRSGNWENLARIYESITPFAQGADTFALSTFAQAIALDPINPSLRIELGGVYYSKADYDNAISVLQLAVSAKPDLANAHYNLAYAYEGKGQNDNAISEMTNVLSLVTDKNSNDYKLAQSSLADFQSKKAKSAPANQSGENLTAPQQKTQPAIKPQVTLPEGAQPPTGKITPTATPTPTIIQSISPVPTTTATPTP